LAIQDSDLAVSGVRIDQAQNFDKNAFASPTSEDLDSETESSETKITAFGRKISNHLGVKTVPALIHGSPEAAND
jgi:hypothetical protein